MATHKYRVGQKVQLVTTLFDRHARVGDYVIVQRLPESHGEIYYRIKGSHEPHERVVKEAQLRKLFDA